MIEILNEYHDHPAFPQPSNRDAFVWRYQDFDKLASLVTTGRLYMRRSDLFNNDQFEGTTPQGEIDYWKKRADEASTLEERATIEHNRAELAEYAEHFRRNYFVSCWNMAPDENVAMWESYTSSPESIVIRSRYSTSAKQFHYGVINVGQVTYINYSLDALPGMNTLRRITHKRHFFSDEQEVRAVVWAVCPEEVKKPTDRSVHNAGRVRLRSAGQCRGVDSGAPPGCNARFRGRRCRRRWLPRQNSN